VLELENAKLSANTSNTQYMHEQKKSCQILLNGEIRVGDSNEINKRKSKIEFDIQESNEQDLSMLNMEDNDHVIIQDSSREDTVVSHSSTLHRVEFGETASSVKSIMQGGHEIYPESAVGQANSENRPLAKLDAVFGKTEVDNCLVDESSGFHEISGIQDDHNRKKRKENKKTADFLQGVSHCRRRYVALKIMYFGQ
ncbi:hypothetical protein KI387_018010, partial [Taxus chinensis]